MGTMELLITRSLQAFAEQGRCEASLGGVPLASTTDRTGQLDQVLGWLFEHGSALYDAKGLFAFKKKFAPQWEPIYLVFPTTADVPRVALAASRAFFPPGWRGFWETLRSLRP